LYRKSKKEAKKLERKSIIKERPPKSSKYILRYGKSLKEIANIFRVSTTTIYNWLGDPKKREWLEEKLNENN